MALQLLAFLEIVGNFQRGILGQEDQKEVQGFWVTVEKLTTVIWGLRVFLKQWTGFFSCKPKQREYWAHLIYIPLVLLFWESSSKCILASKLLMRQKAVTNTNLMIWTFISYCLFQSMLTNSLIFILAFFHGVNIIYICT